MHLHEQIPVDGRLAVFLNPETPPSHLREAERGTLSRWY